MSFAGKPASKEYFSEAEYGVKASPRVSSLRSRLPRGGGRDQVGKPYKIKGKWYKPKEDPDYHKAGMASWYGDAFHGRLTANGEIYDMTHLTAAHPTMPLPSYARVTNTANGNSLVVRVNDRGPYAHGRIIDLSRRAAEMLDYTRHGVAKVEVEYIGRAPLDGQDDQFLLASFRPGKRGPDPSDGLPTGVMIAMNGPTPTAPLVAAAFPAAPASASMPALAEPAFAAGDPVLPDLGPIAPERPGVDLANRSGEPAEPSLMAYAESLTKESAVLSALDSLVDEPTARIMLQPVVQDPPAPAIEPYVAAGTFADLSSAQALADAMASAGSVVVETDADQDAYVVVLRSDGRLTTDDLLRTAWAAGASDAVIVRE